MPKWLPFLVGLFLLFVMYRDPQAAGQFIHDFGSFIVDFFSKVGEFLASLFNTSDAPSSNATNATLPSSPGSDTVIAGDHTFQHTHPVPTTAP